MGKKQLTRRGFLGTAAGAGLAGLASPAFPLKWVPEGGTVDAIPVGHEYRQDDMPAISAAPDGSLWVVWLSFDGERDDIALRSYKSGQWENLQWVPGSSGDSWLPQVAVDAASRVWVVWSQQVEGHWGLYARRFDPQRQEWGTLERWTSGDLPEINPRVWSDGKGHAAAVWRGFRRHALPSTGASSNIFLRTLEGDAWSEEIRVTHRETNDWEPAVALDSQGTVWVAYDSYQHGHYDVFLTAIRGGRVGEEIGVATTPRFDARPTLTVDSLNRVWVAWESGHANWGKDQGRILGKRGVGVPLGGFREPQIRCYANGKWLEPVAPLAAVFRGADTYQPHVFSDGSGSVWVVAKVRKFATQRPPLPQKEAYWETWVPGPLGYWEYLVTHLDAGRWSEPIALPNSKGRSSTRMNAVLAVNHDLWPTWSTDNREEAFYHRPLRQQVFAGAISAVTSSSSGTPELRPVEAEKSQPEQNPSDDASNVAVLRQYRTLIEDKEHRIVRGDFHRHTELSWDEGGRLDGSLQDFYRYMLDVAAMDFGANTEHQGGAWPYWWWYSLKMADMYHVPGAYVGFYAYERSASFPFGHRNVFYPRRADARMVPFFVRKGVELYAYPLTSEGDEPADECGLLVENDIHLLHEEVGARHGITIPHTTGTGMGTDWRDHDPEVEPVVEIFQGLRKCYEQAGAPYCLTEQEAQEAARVVPGWPSVVGTERPEGMVINAWAKGYRLGVIASSDHVSTHISYALAYTDDPTREGILEAFRKRHTYGATDNILLEVRMGENFMGDVLSSSGPLPPLRVKARGTAVISKVDILKDGKVIHSAEPNQQEVSLEYQDDSADGGRHYYYVRLMQKDGMMAWSSPLFINYK
jgi:hypothetical protein